LLETSRERTREPQCERGALAELISWTRPSLTQTVVASPVLESPATRTLRSHVPLSQSRSMSIPTPFVFFMQRLKPARLRRSLCSQQHAGSAPRTPLPPTSVSFSPRPLWNYFHHAPVCVRLMTWEFIGIPVLNSSVSEDRRAM